MPAMYSGLWTMEQDIWTIKRVETIKMVRQMWTIKMVTRMWIKALVFGEKSNKYLKRNCKRIAANVKTFVLNHLRNLMK